MYTQLLPVYTRESGEGTALFEAITTSSFYLDTFTSTFLCKPYRYYIVTLYTCIYIARNNNGSTYLFFCVNYARMNLI